MTQDQYGQMRGPGYAARGDAVPDDENDEYGNGQTENDEYGNGQTKPMTRFQKVASALRGGGPERDDEDPTATDQVAEADVAADQSARDQMGGVDQTARATGPEGTSATSPWATQQDEAAMANSPISRESQAQSQRQGDYWDEPAASAAGRDAAVAVTNPDVPVPEPGTDPLTRQDQMTGQVGADDADHPATQPDMFGTTTHAGNGAASTPQPQAGAATIADVPANGVAAGGTPASDVSASGVPADEAAGTAGRHAAPGSGGTESRPGEAAAALGDFSDLTYGNLLPDATVYMEQWQQVQFKFVDDPHASVTEAADIVGQVTGKIEAAIQERQRAIEERQRAIEEQQRSLRDRWGGEGADADTEALRATLRMYKTFLDQLIGSRAELLADASRTE